MSSLRSQVLSSFKNLHYARKMVFKGHNEGLIVGREKINEEFKKNKHEADAASIEKLIRVANETAEYLRTSVVQAVYQPERDTYEVNITKDTYLIDNVPFNENWKPDKKRRQQSRCDEMKKS